MRSMYRKNGKLSEFSGKEGHTDIHPQSARPGIEPGPALGWEAETLPLRDVLP